MLDVEFENDDLQRLENDSTFNMGLSRAIVRAYRKRMHQIRSMPDERDLYQLNSLQFKKLGGEVADQHQMYLNDQYRLRVKLDKSGPRTKIIILGITK